MRGVLKQMGIQFTINKPKKTVNTEIKGEIQHSKPVFKDNYVIKTVFIPFSINELINLEEIIIQEENQLEETKEELIEEKKTESITTGKKKTTEYHYRTKESLRILLLNADHLKIIVDEKESVIKTKNRIEDGRWEIKTDKPIDTSKEAKLIGSLDLKIMGIKEEYISAADRIRVNIYAIEYSPVEQDENKAQTRLIGSYDMMAMNYLNELLPPSDENSIEI